MLPLVWLVISVASFFGLIKLYRKYHHLNNKRYWEKLGVPVFPEGSGSFNLHHIILDKVTMLDLEKEMGTKMKEHNFDIVGVSEFGAKRLVVLDLEMAKMILVKDSDIWVNRRSFGDLEKSEPILHDMLFFMEGNKWKNMRSLLSPNFTTGKIKRMYERIEDCAQMLVSHIKGQVGSAGSVEIDIPDAMSGYTMDVIASAFFGLEANTIKDRNAIFAKMGKQMQQNGPIRMIKFIIGLVFPQLTSRLGIRFFDPESTEFFHRVVKQTIQHREKTGEKRQDFLQLLIDYKNDPTEEKKVIINDNSIGSQAVLFLLGGFDTESTLLIFTLYELAVHQEFQEKMYEEVQRIKEKHGGKLTYDAVNELEYTEKIINETLRFFPPVPRLERRNIQDYRIPGTKTVLPKNSMVSIPNFFFHMNPEFFPNPEKFDPERWSPEAKNERNPYSYLPFGTGPRNCIGQRFALVEAKSILAHLALNFKIEPTSRLQIPMKITTRGTMKPKGDMFIKFTPRN